MFPCFNYKVKPIFNNLFLSCGNTHFIVIENEKEQVNKMLTKLLMDWEISEGSLLFINIFNLQKIAITKCVGFLSYLAFYSVLTSSPAYLFLYTCIRSNSHSNVYKHCSPRSYKYTVFKKSKKICNHNHLHFCYHDLKKGVHALY